MPTKVTITQLKSRMADDLDAYAIDFLPPDSFARHAYENKPYPEIRRAHSAEDADKAECERWDLTAERASRPLCDLFAGAAPMFSWAIHGEAFSRSAAAARRSACRSRGPPPARPGTRPARTVRHAPRRS